MKGPPICTVDAVVDFFAAFVACWLASIATGGLAVLYERAANINPTEIMIARTANKGPIRVRPVEPFLAVSGAFSAAASDPDFAVVSVIGLSLGSIFGVSSDMGVPLGK